MKREVAVGGRSGREFSWSMSEQSGECIPCIPTRGNMRHSVTPWFLSVPFRWMIVDRC